MPYNLPMQIALFGGAFDPPHMGHRLIAEHLLEAGKVDRVWFVPVRKHHFVKNMTAVVDRLAMLQQMVVKMKLPTIKIEKFELEHNDTSYSYNTLEGLSERYSQDTFSWVIGSDNIADFHKWYRATELLHTYHVFVYPRAGFPLQSLLPGMIPLTDMPEINVSSTEVRERVRARQPIEGLVEETVAQYISQKGLYVSTLQ